MKKFLTLFAVATLCATAAIAQGEAIPTTAPSATKTIPQNDDEFVNKRKATGEKWKNASAEEKEKMKENQGDEGKRGNHRAMMAKLSPQQREAVKAERKRHREEMKKITGFEPKEHKENKGRGGDQE